MDFLDRLALALTKPKREKRDRRAKRHKSSKQGADINNENIALSMSIAPKPKMAPIKRRDNYAEIYYRSPEKVLNDNFHNNEAVATDRRSRRTQLLEDILPFIGARRFDWGVWAYRNRYGVFITTAAYLSMMFIFWFVSFRVTTIEIPEGIFIDTEQVAELEQMLEELNEKAVMDIENAISDENSKEDIEDIYNEELPESEDEYSEVEDISVEDLLDEADALLSSNNNYNQYEQRKAEIERETIEERELAREERRQKQLEQERKNQFSKKRGNVTVSYNLKGRKATFLEIPAFLCKGGGQVILDITVDRKGEVVNASVKSTIGVSDSCLPETAIWAAKRSKFNVSKSAPARQKGTMTYHFVAQ